MIQFRMDHNQPRHIHFPPLLSRCKAKSCAYLWSVRMLQRNNDHWDESGGGNVMASSKIRYGLLLLQQRSHLFFAWRDVIR